MNDYTWQKVSAALSAMEKQERLFSEIIDKIGAAYESPIANPFFVLQAGVRGQNWVDILFHL